MRASEELVKSKPITEKVIKPATVHEETSINWKSTLSNILCKTENQLNSERAWARFCEALRDLCPETTWYALCENHPDTDESENIEALYKWIQALSISSHWPFPKKAMITSTNESGQVWKIIFPKVVSPLPYVNPPAGLTVTPLRDKNSSGWKIQAIETFNVDKAGEA